MFANVVSASVPVWGNTTYRIGNPVSLTVVVVASRDSPVECEWTFHAKWHQVAVPGPQAVLISSPPVRTDTVICGRAEMCDFLCHAGDHQSVKGIVHSWAPGRHEADRPRLARGQGATYDVWLIMQSLRRLHRLHMRPRECERRALFAFLFP